MVILIASDKTRVRRGLADRLREKTLHKVLTAASIAEMEMVPEQEGALDLLVFSPVFSEPGREVRARLRLRYPHLQTVVLDDKTPLEQSLANLMRWVGVEPEEAGEMEVTESPPAPIPAPGTVRAVSADSDETGEAGEVRKAVEPLEDAGAETDFFEASPQPEAGTGDAEEEAPVELLGDYQLKELMHSTETTLIYRAVQRSVRRPVALERLRPELAGDAAAARQFRQMVRARALVSHPVIAAVYEAQETGDVLFHTSELVPGETLPALAAAGRHFPQQTLLAVLQAAAEAMVWMEEHAIPYEPVRPEYLLLSPGGTPRMQNPAAPELPSRRNTTAGSLAQLAAMIQRLAEPRSAQTRELAHVLGLMRSPGPHGIHSWKNLSRETRASLQRLTEAHTAVSPESPDRTQARRRRYRHFLGWAAIVTLLLTGIGAGVGWWRRAARAKVRDLSGMVRIPAGPLHLLDGQQVEVPEFWISRHEVTLDQYARFLDNLPQGLPGRFDHPDQPASKKSHMPTEWEQILNVARRGGAWHGHPLTPNSPVFNVDWWDAWAFAKWADARLPTEEEWLKAARGSEGRLWPWGNEANTAAANTGSDYNPAGNGGGRNDGHSWWCDVDAMPEDRTPEGVMGMAGNVAEWTSSFVPDPDFPDAEVPVFRGGDFHQTSPVPLNAAPWLAKGALYAQPFLGFRTASSKEIP